MLPTLVGEENHYDDDESGRISGEVCTPINRDDDLGDPVEDINEMMSKMKIDKK